MRRFAADLRVTGELRDDLTDEQVADVRRQAGGSGRTVNDGCRCAVSL